ncbi:eukaryotic initiation factor 4E [Tetraselmis virus 1]|uniref:Eukaryotic initiation factor 4E n=1 Tax=Tetraselmis virus 1 TaxID=2060617 RepID=A0A2P0VN84_9VIRU|nr:eukaryotic initiation factor 4E [Tetraselmis virus 1]AUF82209.1 eukaryotic initiation factor 4E [Tetraselmis virus 1]
MSYNQSDNEVFLDDIWCLYFHDPDDRNWTFSSYLKISSLSSAEEFWGLQGLLKDKICRGMFFIMREHVFPCWDDPANIEGGCISFMVPKDDVGEVWQEMCVRLLTERLAEESDIMASINGLSASPKNDFCIIKIWLGEATPVAASDFDLPQGVNTGIFTLNRAKIASSN